jgi:DNA-binding NarL/FixJ family response regulator
MRRKKPAHNISYGKPLSAHEAGKISPHGSDKPAAPPRKVRYDPDEHSPLEKPLTVREEQMLELVADGKSNSEISEAENIALKTVAKHIENIYPKIGVNDRAGAAIWFLKKKIRQMERQIAQLRRQLAQRRR